MITLMHSNPVRLDRGVLFVDRKFHLGMQNYLSSISHPIVSIHPESAGRENTMDMLEVPLKGLGYRVMAINNGTNAAKAAQDAAHMADQIRSSRLVYGGGLGSEALCAVARIPQIAVLEYDLATRIKVSTSQVGNPLRKVSRALRVYVEYLNGIADLRRSAGIHCNGYPIFDATEGYNANRLLYLDSRMYKEMVISDQQLETRLSRPNAGPLKLLFSGRFDPIKGAVDAVRVGLACVVHGLDIELHCYGQGIQRDDMLRLASHPSAQGRIHIHEAVTYPELLKIARDFDVFVCCHVQSDPSCTYLESFGSGLPIVGYANRMWRRLCEESGAGFSSPLNQPNQVVEGVKRIVGDADLRRSMSRRARQFALSHTFECEFKLRTDDINRTLEKA
jgi:glycosyltransferase involved in cell wall biosynthesis